MENVKKIVSQNLTKLRKEKNMTQAELAKLINYSDKAISRWETGEVVPDLETIYALSEVFGVPVSAITEAQKEKKAEEDYASSSVSQKVLSQIFLVCEIWFIICAAFVYLKISRHTDMWQLFVLGVPATALLLWFCNRKEPANTLLFIFATIFIWSLITCVYLNLLSSNPWYIYFLGLPLQGLVIIRYIFNYKQNLKRIRLRRGQEHADEQAQAEEQDITQ